jgi:hypothetical protein
MYKCGLSNMLDTWLVFLLVVNKHLITNTRNMLHFKKYLCSEFVQMFKVMTTSKIVTFITKSDLGGVFLTPNSLTLHLQEKRLSIY